MCPVEYWAIRRSEQLYAEHVAAVSKMTVVVKYIMVEDISTFTAYGDVRTVLRVIRPKLIVYYVYFRSKTGSPC